MEIANHFRRNLASIGTGLADLKGKKVAPKARAVATTQRSTVGMGASGSSERYESSVRPDKTHSGAEVVESMCIRKRSA